MEALAPHVTAIKVVISDALLDVNALIGASADVILADVHTGVAVTVTVLAGLIADLLIVRISLFSRRA